MDHIFLKQLARLKFKLRQEKLGTVDLERFASDNQYARCVLETAEESESEEVVSLAVELRHKRGLLGAPANGGQAARRQTHDNTVTARKTATTEPAPAKYMFGARG